LNRLETAQVFDGTSPIGTSMDPSYSAAGRLTTKTDVGSYTYTGGG
jgi:hypothetical protein